jgi:predicted HicB family RNase H-like nuclease
MKGLLMNKKTKNHCIFNDNGKFTHKWKSETKHTGLRIPIDLLEKLSELAKKQGISRTDLIVQTLYEKVESLAE